MSVWESRCRRCNEIIATTFWQGFTSGGVCKKCKAYGEYLTKKGENDWKIGRDEWLKEAR